MSKRRVSLMHECKASKEFGLQSMLLGRREWWLEGGVEKWIDGWLKELVEGLVGGLVEGWVGGLVGGGMRDGLDGWSDNWLCC